MKCKVTLTLTMDEAKMLEQAAGQMEDDWTRVDGQTWAKFKSYTGLSKKDHDAYHSAIKKLFNAAHFAEPIKR